MNEVLNWLSSGELAPNASIGAVATWLFSTFATKYINKPGADEGVVGILKAIMGRIGAGKFKDAEGNWSLPGSTAE